MKFTKTEIDLCRQIAKKHKRFPRKGDWEYNDNTKETKLKIYEYLGMANPLTGEVNIFLLWTIEDCLEFLREKGFLGIQLLGSESWVLWANKEHGGIYEMLGDGKTPLEALLKAVLAVLKKEE